ncbi:MAG TPA: type II toxin-antitoxin system RelE/ParE family toxin [Methylomirabilota bacterium]|nr:type II toxin-antitoxin system RelE/ParE family toxin [Methylomirabilota bacterium]
MKPGEGFVGRGFELLGWRMPRRVPTITVVAHGYKSLDQFLKVAHSYEMKSKSISYTKASIRALRRMPANTATLIRSKIEAYALDPASQANNIKSLRGREGIRLRVGGWRVIMDDQGNVLAVLDIGPRGGVYD